MTIRFKDFTVCPTGVSPELHMGLLVVLSHWPDDVDMVWTSCTDGRHSRKSKHPRGDALDIRSKGFSGDIDKLSFVKEMHKRALGLHYDFILEDLGGKNEHFHMEFDPERPR